ncbi:MAG: ATP-binding protein [Phycisphaerales bacterium]|nr:ATP-binding protein [Phycisphaerales bacterium]
MAHRCESFLLLGIDAELVEVEVNASKRGLPQTSMVGLPDAAVRESSERIRNAVESCGLEIPRHRVTINLAPADRRKEGVLYDLPIAIALLDASGAFASAHASAPRVSDYLIAGELALDGRLRPIRGACPMAVLAATLNRRGVVVPRANVEEAGAVTGIEVLGAQHLAEVVAHFRGEGGLTHSPRAAPQKCQLHEQFDFSQIRGQESAKRVMTIAAAGAHNVLMVGPAGCGKTMMARALPGIMPPLLPSEVIEVLRIHSAAGLQPPGGGQTVRPVRAPHHGASAAAIVGGGRIVRPGEASLAHRGILFLDELPEFARDVLESLREPLEERRVTIARVSGTVRMPAQFQLVAAMNPSARGGSGVAGNWDAARYLARLSGPLVDRIDLHVELPAVRAAELACARTGASSADLAAIVSAARSRQALRQGETYNADLSPGRLDQIGAFEPAAISFLVGALAGLGLSARGWDKVRRVARTIADIEGDERVRDDHVAEAVQYRFLDRALAAA